MQPVRRHTIRLTQQKTRQPVAVPVHPALKAELDSWRLDRSAITILTDKHGKPWDGNLLSHFLASALPRIGLGNDMSLHGLRWLAAVRLAEAGCYTHEIAAITGTLQLIQYYTRAADRERLAALQFFVWRLGTKRGRKPKA
jgi:integrase